MKLLKGIKTAVVDIAEDTRDIIAIFMATEKTFYDKYEQTNSDIYKTIKLNKKCNHHIFKIFF